jgi:hypothetical protein
LILPTTKTNGRTPDFSMNSPFILRNALVLLLTLASFSFCICLLRVQGQANVAAHHPPAWRVAARAAAFTGAAATLIVLLAAIVMFCSLELPPEARACWRRNALWPQIRVGMTTSEVVKLLGKPAQEDSFNPPEGRQYSYYLHP